MKGNNDQNEDNWVFSPPHEDVHVNYGAAERSDCMGIILKIKKIIGSGPAFCLLIN